jgi:hypothetical protein
VDAAGAVGEAEDVVRTAEATFPAAGPPTEPQPAEKSALTASPPIHLEAFIICIGNVTGGD